MEMGKMITISYTLNIYYSHRTEHEQYISGFTAPDMNEIYDSSFLMSEKDVKTAKTIHKNRVQKNAKKSASNFN